MYIPMRRAGRAACVSIFLLALPAAAATQEDVQHTIRPGQTLFAIAKRYGVGVAELMQRNGLAARAVLRPGQSLVIDALDGSANALPAATGSP